jgi:hypothetical protein
VHVDAASHSRVLSVCCPAAQQPGQAGTGVDASGVLVNCSCDRCNTHIFYFIYIKSGDENLRRWCGQCARDSGSKGLRLARRFLCPEPNDDLVKMWNNTKDMYCPYLPLTPASEGASKSADG